MDISHLETETGPCSILNVFLFLLSISLGALFGGLEGLTGFLYRGSCSIHPTGALDPTSVIALCLLRQGVALCLFQGALGAHSVNSAGSSPPLKLQQVSGSHL